MAVQIPFSIPSHSRRVCSLYKRAVRCIEAFNGDRAVFRYKATLMRDRFEQNRCVSDPIAAHKLLVDGEEELFKSQHWQPKMWPKTIGGNAYGRVSFVPDWVLDYWHPLEKAQYPEYFARREQRKEEFIRMWEKEYGNDPEDKSHHH